MMRLSEVLRGRCVIDELHLLSYENDIYLVRVVIGADAHVVRHDKTGLPLKFRSLDSAKKPFRKAHILAAYLVQEVPFTEHLNREDGFVEPMKVRTSLPREIYAD